eukprot:COSAG02_NODE_57604_length_280_cov_0.569061_1_plen_20_part_10
MAHVADCGGGGGAGEAQVGR